MYRVVIAVLLVLLCFFLYKSIGIKKTALPPSSISGSGASGSSASGITEIIGKNESFSQVYKPMITLHYTTWCPACSSFKPLWEELKKDTRYDFAENDEDKNPTAGITGFPTITASYGANLHKYIGVRDYDSIMNWINSPK